jgi:phospho-N-acetylmuramoyl-pentapeptide-transferase
VEQSSEVIAIFLLATIAFVVTMFWTPLLTKYLFRYHLTKQIRASEQTPIYSKLHKHKAGTLTMGGVLVWGTTIVLAIVIFYLARLTDNVFIDRLNFLSRPETLLPLGVLLASALVGLVDDFWNVKRIGAAGGGLRVRHRLIIYSIIAAVGAWWFYYKLDWTTIHVPFVGNFDIGLWYIPIFLFVIVATSFSVNEADGLDGLAGGVLLTSFGAYGVIAVLQGRFDLAAFCAVIIGALLAFLWFNIPPARFFMGDTGAMSLGVTLGVVAMLTNEALLLPIIGFVLAIESFSVIVQLTARKLFRRKVFISAPLHHHYEAKGWSESKIVMRAWVISGVFGVIGLIIFLVDTA